MAYERPHGQSCQLGCLDMQEQTHSALGLPGRRTKCLAPHCQHRAGMSVQTLDCTCMLYHHRHASNNNATVSVSVSVERRACALDLLVHRRFTLGVPVHACQGVVPQVCMRHRLQHRPHLHVQNAAPAHSFRLPLPCQGRCIHQGAEQNAGSRADSGERQGHTGCCRHKGQHQAVGGKAPPLQAGSARSGKTKPAAWLACAAAPKPGAPAHGTLAQLTTPVRSLTQRT